MPSLSSLNSLVSFAGLVAATIAQTNFTGDTLHGAQVITHLSLADVPPNSVTRYYLRVPSVLGGWDMHLPVFVARGSSDTLNTGTKLSVSSSIHGDELNPVRVAQQLLEKLERWVPHLNGTVIGLPTMNPTGNYLSQRNYYTGSGSGTLSNLNRLFPGEDPDEGASGPSSHVYTIWNNLWGNTSNVDIAVDMHTASTGTENPMWVYADVRAPYVSRMAELAQPDVLKIDPGEPGSVETTFVSHGVPAITLELGGAKQWNARLIERAGDFLDRLMVDLHMLPQNATCSIEPDLSRTYIGNVFHSLPSRFGGFVEPLVGVLDDVTAGDDVAIVRNAWGDILEVVKAPVDGKIFSIPRDPATEPGRDAAQLVYNSTTIEGCEFGCIVSSRNAIVR